MKAVRLGHVISQDGKAHEHHMKVKGPMPLDVDGLVARLSSEDDLAGFSVMPRDE
jgi:putative Mg2+ transporter-C (MgtC) family protein